MNTTSVPHHDYRVGVTPSQTKSALHGHDFFLLASSALGHQETMFSFGNLKGSVQLNDIATALNIIEIRYVPLTSFEGALLTTPERRNGSILINSNARPERQRFTLGHELGHYLNVWHEPPDDGGFMCKSAEVKFGKFFAKQGLSQHEVQELQPIRRLLFDPAPEPMTDSSGISTRALHMGGDKSRSTCCRRCRPRALL